MRDRATWIMQMNSVRCFRGPQYIWSVPETVMATPTLWGVVQLNNLFYLLVVCITVLLFRPQSARFVNAAYWFTWTSYMNRPTNDIELLGLSSSRSCWSIGPREVSIWNTQQRHFEHCSSRCCFPAGLGWFFAMLFSVFLFFSCLQSLPTSCLPL